MSTRQSYNYVEQQQAGRRREAELARRQMRLAEQRARCAAIAHRQMMERLRVEQQRAAAARQQAERLQAERLQAERLQAERLQAERLQAERLQAQQRQAAEARRRTTEQLRQTESQAQQVAATRRKAEGQLNAQARQIETVTQDAEATRQNLARLKQELEASRANLAVAVRELRVEMDQAARIEAEIGQEVGLLTEAIVSAQSSLDQLADVARQTVESLRELSPAEQAHLVERQVELEDEIHQLQSEVRFLTHDAAVAPAAMVTLMAMETNGYKLRETVSRDGLISYFARRDEEHQIAVRVAKISLAGEAAERWDVVAETFKMSGEDCLYEIEDFETAVKELDFGILTPGQRVYPKGEGGVHAATGLPEPTRSSTRLGAHVKLRKARE